MMFETAFCTVAAAMVLYRTLGVIGKINPGSFDGHPWQFISLTIHYALVGAGSVATALGLSIGGIMLLAGLAMMALSDRRNRS